MAKQNKILTAVVSLSGKIDPSLGKAMEELSGHLEKVNWKAAAVGAAAGGIAVATGKAVLKAGKYLTGLGDDWNKTMNQLSASTGIVGDELAEIGESVKDVYAKGLGDSMEDVANALSTVKQNSGLVGEELEAATAAAFNMRDVFGYDINEASRTASALMKNFGISADEAYGLMATGAQKGADKNGDMLDALNEYSGQFAALGLSADQFLDTLVGGAEAGLFSVDKVGDAVKEFNIRAKDGSESSREAFEGLGLNADRMFEAFAAGGDSAEAAFFDTVEALNNLEDPLLKNQLGVSLFGSQFEDLEAGVLPVLADIETAAYDGAEALQQINDVKYDDLGTAFEQIKRSAEVALLPMASMMANTLTDLSPILNDLMESVIPVVSETMEQCMPFVEEFLIGTGDAIKGLLPMFQKLASSLLPILSKLCEQLLPPALDLIEGLLYPLMEITQAVLPPLVGLLSSVLPILVQVCSSVLPVLVQMFNSILPVIEPILGMALQLVNDVVMPLLSPLRQICEALLPVLSTTLGTVVKLLGPIFDLLGPIMDVLGPLAVVLGEIIGWIAKVVGWVADGLAWVVDLFTSGGSKDEVKGYATGGFTNGVSIAGEDPRYPTEAVLSFNPAYRSENLSYWAKAGQMLGANGSDYEYLSGGGGTSVVYDLTGLSFSPKIEVHGNADEESLVRKLKELEPEFIDFVLEALSRREGGAYVTADSRLY